MDATLIGNVLMIAAYYAAGLFVWPIYRQVFFRKFPLAEKGLRRIFLLTTGTLLLFLVAICLAWKFEVLDYNWLPLLLIAPAINIASLAVSFFHMRKHYRIAIALIRS